MENVIIIGSGPAGLTAAIYAARANLNPLVIAGYQSGGQLMLTTEVENFPGFVEGIMGPELMMNMRSQAERFGARFVDKDVTGVDFSDTHHKKIIAGDETFEAKTVIIATGASARWLDVPGETDFRGRGVSTCATCDGAFFRNKVIAVVGGGDSAMEEANFLTRFASKLYLIHRRNEFRASKIMQDRVMNNPKIEVVYNSVVAEVQGEQSVKNVKLENTETHEISDLAIDGLFIAIGHDPNTKFLAGQIELDEKGYVVTKGEFGTQTSVDGVFVAGDVFDVRYRQAITAAGSGCKAALDAEKYLEGHE
jgi:thioredoxin reductase (NADPH)